MHVGRAFESLRAHQKQLEINALQEPRPCNAFFFRRLCRNLRCSVIVNVGCAFQLIEAVKNRRASVYETQALSLAERDVGRDGSETFLTRSRKAMTGAPA